jgi:4-amino-4-deoxy-L-arabinose transferase-like glycosyltransferase
MNQMGTVPLEPDTTEKSAAAAPRPLRPWAVALFAVAVVAAYCFSLHLGALAEPDEPRYAEIAREMLARHDWVTPTLNYVKYFEKPPLVYWLTAIDFSFLGVSDWSARLVPVFAALGTLLLTWAVGRRGYGSWAAVIGTGLVAISPLFFAMGQTLTLDMPLTFFLTLAAACFWFWWQDPGRPRAWLIGLYVSVALGVLTKGPVAIVLTGGIIGLFLLVRRDWAAMWAGIDRVGIGVFCLVALPWFVLVSIRNPEFPDFFIMDQHVRRFLSTGEHHQPIWFFLPIVFASLLPWSVAVLLVPSWSSALRRFREWSPLTWFCLIWSAVIIGFFSLSTSKLGTYIVPALPPLALLTARALRDVVAADAPLGPRLAPLLLLLGAGMVIGGLVVLFLTLPLSLPLTPYLWAGGAVLLAAGWWMRRQRDTQRALATGMWAMLALLSVAISGRGVTTSYRHLGLAIRTQVQPGDEVLIYRHYVQGIPLYTQRRAVMVVGKGELDFGSRQGDQSAFFWPTDAQLLRAWASPTRVFLVINRTELEPLRSQLSSPPIEIAAEGKKVVVVNHPVS